MLLETANRLPDTQLPSGAANQLPADYSAAKQGCQTGLFMAGTGYLAANRLPADCSAAKQGCQTGLFMASTGYLAANRLPEAYSGVNQLPNDPGQLALGCLLDRLGIRTRDAEAKNQF